MYHLIVSEWINYCRITVLWYYRYCSHPVISTPSTCTVSEIPAEDHMPIKICFWGDKSKKATPPWQLLLLFLGICVHNVTENRLGHTYWLFWPEKSNNFIDGETIFEFISHRQVNQIIHFVTVWIKLLWQANLYHPQMHSNQVLQRFIPTRQEALPFMFIIFIYMVVFSGQQA